MLISNNNHDVFKWCKQILQILSHITVVWRSWIVVKISRSKLKSKTDLSHNFSYKIKNEKNLSFDLGVHFCFEKIRTWTHAF